MSQQDADARIASHIRTSTNALLKPTSARVGIELEVDATATYDIYTVEFAPNEYTTITLSYDAAQLSPSEVARVAAETIDRLV
jgi:hypothetical protein